jgi:hypothetical protein
MRPIMTGIQPGSNKKKKKRIFGYALLPLPDMKTLFFILFHILFQTLTF